MDELISRGYFGWFMKQLKYHLDDPRNWNDLKDDEKNMKRMLEHLNNSDKDYYMEIDNDPKSSKKAIEFINKGNEEYRDAKSWQSSLELYTEAVIHAYPNSNELARAYANRSAALFDGGLYDDAILDIGRALEIGYPDDLKAELYARRAQCFLALNKVTPSETNIQRDVANARKWLTNMNPVDKERVIEILDKKFSDFLTKNVPFEKLDYRMFVPKIPDSNPKILRASSAIKLQFSEEFGRHVVATRDINVGEVLFVHEAYGSVIDRDVIHKYCTTCGKRVWSGVPCLKCVSVIYCNENCRDEAWQEFHDLECLMLPRMLTTKEFSRVQVMGLRITIRAYKEAGTMEKLKEKIDKMNAKQDSLTKGFSGDVFDNTKYESVYFLSRNGQPLYKLWMDVSIMIIGLAASTDMFERKYDSLNEFLKDKWAIFMSAFLLRNYDIAISNSKQINLHDGNKWSTRGSSFHSLFSLFNHSCDPMAHTHLSGTTASMFAVQKIKKGEQIFINYRSACWEESATERKANLLHYLKFHCVCKPCTKNFGPDDVKSLGLQTINWPFALRKKQNQIRKRCPIPDVMNSNDIVARAMLLSLNIDKMKFYYRTYRYPTNEIMPYKIELIQNLMLCGY